MWGTLSKDSSAYMDAEFSRIIEELNRGIKHVKFKKSKGSAKDGYYPSEEIEELADSNEIIICSDSEWTPELRAAGIHLRDAFDIVINNAGENGGVSNDLFKIIEHAFRAGERKAIADKFHYLQIANQQAPTIKNQFGGGRKTPTRKPAFKYTDPWVKQAITIFENKPNITQKEWIDALEKKTEEKKRSKRGGYIKLTGVTKPMSHSMLKKHLRKIKAVCLETIKKHSTQ